LPYTFQPGAIYRMPTHFGPSQSPRQGPDGQRFDWSSHEFEAFNLFFRSDAAALDKIVPPGFALLDDPVVTLSFGYLHNLPWLAGRGYNILGARIPVRFRGAKDTAVGSLSLVLWENMADPILTGREELGVSKIFCDIAAPRRSGGKVHCEASWGGFRFLEAVFEDVTEVDPATKPADPGPDTGGNLLHYKYFPRTGQWGEADVACVTLTPPAADARVKSAATARGGFAFHRPHWEDMPTQFRVVNGLADLPMVEMLGASILTLTGTFDLYDQKVLR